MNFKLGSGFTENSIVTGQVINGSLIVKGKLSFLAFDFAHIKAGYYISNAANKPFAHRVEPESLNIIASESP